MSLGWVVAPVYFIRDVGMSPLELVLAGTALEVAYTLFEVPTSVVADTFSRRVSVVVAQVVMGVAFLLTAAIPSVAVILGAAALMGFGWTFKSGAEDAWLADEVGRERLGRSYQRGAQVERALALVGIGVAVALAVVDLRLPIAAGGALFVVLGIGLAIFMPETGFRPGAAEQLGALRSMARTAIDGGRLVRARPFLLLVIGIAFFGGVWSEAFDRLWEAQFLLEVGVPRFGTFDPVVWFGVLNAGALLLALAVAQPLVGGLERLPPERLAGVLLVLDATLVAATLAFALAGSFVLAVAAFWAVGVARSLARPIFSTWVNASVTESRTRATVISITYLGDSVGECGGGPAVGAVGSLFSVRAALVAGAAALSPALWLYGRAARHADGPAEVAGPA